jgi:hypothetical protein
MGSLRSRRYFKVVGLGLAWALGATNAIAQKLTAPVDAIMTPPLTRAVEGEDASGTIKVTAEANLDRLELTIQPQTGVEIRSTSRVATFTNTESGQTREIPIVVRLIDSTYGRLIVIATTTVRGERRTKSFTFPVGAAAPAPERRRDFGVNEELSNLTFLNSNGTQAVVRFRANPLQLISVGDHLGKNKAEVKTIEADRLVLEETFIDPDGQANKAQIILKKGETGGTRYLQRPDNDAPPARRPVPVAPTGSTLRK